MGKIFAAAPLLGTMAVSFTAYAQVPEIHGRGSTGATATPDPTEATGVGTATSTSWMERFVPDGMCGEMGLFLGMMFPSPDHNFHDEFGEYEKLANVAFDFGLRGSFFPVAYGGIEIEGALVPTATRDDQGVTVWAVRGHGILQAPFWRISPFGLVGGGRMGALSEPLDNDADPLVHWGLGAKLAINDRVLARLDIRDNLTQRNDASEGALTHHPEVLLGLSYRVPPTKVPEAPILNALSLDVDRDGFDDPRDACPNRPGIAPNGCPSLDADQDSFRDEVDRCPTMRGVAPHGCPPIDADADGFFDDSDNCPQEVGVAPDGCPPADTDADGIRDPDDRCRDQPESVNAYEDEDGCPDELPQAVQEFTGAIQGIQFDTGQATIKPASYATLDQAVRVLSDYPKLRIEISGHTDNVGKRETNLDLSQRRAASVETYLVEKGIDASRIETVGYGPDRPLVSNDSAQSRGQNRRIEFRLLR